MGKVIWGHIILVVSAFVIAYWPKFFPITGNELGYCALCYCLIFPLIAMLCCFLCGLHGVMYGLLCAFITGLAAIAIPYPIFGGLWRETLLLPCVGAVIGVALSTLPKRHKKDNDGR